MIDIENLKFYEKNGLIFMTGHAKERAKQRGISMENIRDGIKSGIVIEDYEDDTPYPSCLVLGYTNGNRPIHLVLSDSGEASLVITTYYPSEDKWEQDFKIRKV